MLISLVLGVCSCKNQNVERNLFIVKDLVGQNLILPDSLVFFNMDGQNIDLSSTYKCNFLGADNKQ